MSSMRELRESAAEDAWLDHDFEPEQVKDCDGWNQAGDEWSRVYYLDRGDEPSERAVFVVRFQPGTAKIKTSYPQEQGSSRGGPRTERDERC